MILSLGISSPIVRDGKVVGFHDGFQVSLSSSFSLNHAFRVSLSSSFSLNHAFQAGRKFAVDMAGFAVNLRVLHANPQATIPTRLSYLEDGFLRNLRLELDDLEPLASGCTQVLVWHTKTHKPGTPSLEHVTHTDFDTNLVGLYRNILR
ncbi:Galactosylgalactosylxylosylprotein 3-beta-glucuronosyltransferase S-like 1 [Homarus americanus]|uniref:Galactosylgalactosylxylosylprotein 3-beta-glucuronosyltransferase n=1 Tax=Homarus americanus TaxID=6706 RepID=A0A8J5NEK7_HOMAM|nr:Galactosylgalactosylxylosylprotein 3-beta-glucuronosyltransferase S-like 1 [Homarus americanus]